MRLTYNTEYPSASTPGNIGLTEMRVECWKTLICQIITAAPTRAVFKKKLEEFYINIVLKIIIVEGFLDLYKYSLSM